ncbi:MAG: tetratricopeptide (TPR) repeat protein [Rhodothermales bacterium]|jgi:tetratricopeptide (TPR) repeat protein
MIKQAQMHMDAGQFAQAETIYRSIIADDGSNTEAVFMLALARQAQGDIDNAIKLLKQAGSQQPDNANIHYALATTYMSQKSAELARSSYLGALQADPTHIDSHNGLAFVELISGNFKAAENAANLALGEDRRNVQALVYLGTAKLEQKDTDKAIAYLQEALKESPQHQSAQLHLGRAFLAADNLAFATKCFENLVEADDNFALGWEYLGVVNRANGVHEDARVCFLKAYSLGRQSPLVLENLAEYEKLEGNTQPDAQSQGFAGAQPGVDPEVQFTAAEFEIARGNPAAALAVLDKIEAGDNIRVALLKSRAFEQMRDHEAALVLIEPLVISGEATEEAQLAYVRLLSKAGRQEMADQWIDGLLAGTDPPLFAQMFRGFQLCQSGNEEGIKVLQELETHEGLSNVDQRRIGKTLAEALDRAGRFKEAAAYYLKLTGRMAQIVAVAESSANNNRELLEKKKTLAPGLRVNTSILPADPVFLFAWPGSGWEWLAAGLGAHSGVMLVADKPETQAKRRALVNTPAGPTELELFTPDSAGIAAGQYWSDLKSGELEPGNKTTIDTMWMSADMLPTIARIFPSARVIVAGRDSKSMVLDWFRSGYADLQDMAAIYRDQCEAMQGYREIVPLEFIDVDGDALQSKASAELRDLCEKLGLAWEESVGSRIEAIAPKVDKSRGQWSDYAKELAGPLKLFESE